MILTSTGVVPKFVGKSWHFIISISRLENLQNFSGSHELV